MQRLLLNPVGERQQGRCGLPVRASLLWLLVFRCVASLLLMFEMFFPFLVADLPGSIAIFVGYIEFGVFKHDKCLFDRIYHLPEWKALVNQRPSLSL